MKLFCFTYAGGNASFYDQVEKEAKKDFDVVKIEYAGHGKRHKEPFYQNFSELADDLYILLKSALNGQEAYALFGYSMGSISAVEVLRRIIISGEIQLPVHIFLAAHEPYTKVEPENYSGKKLDEYVKMRTIQFGAVPDKLIDNESFWRVYLPIYRSDYSMIGKYRFENLNLNTEIPATVFYSETDTPYNDMRQWKDYFAGNCEFFEYSGNHFFINAHCREIIDIVRKRLENYL